MAQTIEDQITTIEQALGERMIEHALVIVRAWLNELGENNPFEQAYQDIRTHYDTIFEEWLTSDDPQREEALDGLTGDTYRLVDASYAQIRLKRGLSPDMKGFNPENPKSVMYYFTSCLTFTQEDYKWLNEVSNDPDRAAIALMAVAAIAKNLRECFNEQALLALIDGINAENEVVSEQCLANALLLLAHYDVRIDFFPQIQSTFLEAVANLDEEGEQAFQTLCAIVTSVKTNWRDDIASGKLRIEDLPEELQQLLELTGESNSMDGVASWVPASEQEYMQGIVQIMPETWVFDAVIGDSKERAGKIAIVYLSVGHMDLLWNHTEVALTWLRQHLRTAKPTPMDYINYANCLLLKGDRMMAFEYYRRARHLCKGPREFFALFRPDRRQLVDHGVPIEQVYMLEDQLINN